MYTFIKKPISIEAFQMTRERSRDHSEWPEWLRVAWSFGLRGDRSAGAMWAGFGRRRNLTTVESLYCGTLEGFHAISFGDYIIRGVQGEIYPCKPDIFEKTYYTEVEYAALEDQQ